MGIFLTLLIRKKKRLFQLSTRSDLMRIHNKNLELGLQVNTTQQKLDYEVEVSQALRAEKESMDKKYTESMAQTQMLEEEVARLKEEVKKSEVRKRFFKEKAFRFESGKFLNQNIINAIMKSFFSSEAWRNAQIDNFISSAWDVRDTFLEKHPDIKDKLLCINYKADRLITTEKQQLRAENKEVPPTPEPPIDFDEEEYTESQVKEVENTDLAEVHSEPVVEKTKGEPSNKGKEIAKEVEEAAKDPALVASKGIFEGCGSFEKI